MGATKRVKDTELFELFNLEVLYQDGMDSWLQETIGSCARWFQASDATVFLMDKNGDLRLRAQADNKSRIPAGASIPKGDGVAWRVLRAGIPKLIGSLSDDLLFSNSSAKGRNDLTSSMVLPILDPKKHPLGVINFSRKLGEPEFVPSDLKLCSKVADQIALAVSNALLFELTKNSLSELDRRAEELQAVLNCVPGSVFLFDNDGYFQNLLPESHTLREAIESTVTQVLESRVPTDFRVTDPQCHQSWLVHIAPLDSGGGVINCHDITEIDRAQAESSRLRRLAEIGQMTATVAHELRNPLTGIRGAAQLLSGDYSLAAECSSIILEEANRMSKLCDDFLEISRPLSLKLSSQSLATVTGRIVELKNKQFQEKGIELIFRELNKEPLVMIDIIRIEQVIHNLLNNALDACSNGDQVTITVDGQHITVSDTGVGMDEEHVAKLFAPFFTTKPDGNGLGLCNVKRIVDAHGGQLGVHSSPQKGTDFYIQFTRAAA